MFDIITYWKFPISLYYVIIPNLGHRKITEGNLHQPDWFLTDY